MSVSGPSENDEKKSVNRLAAFGARVMTEDEANEYINRVAERLEKNIETTEGIDQLADNYFRQVIEQTDKSTNNLIEKKGETKDDRLAQFGARLMNEDEANEYIDKISQRLKEGPIEDNN